ncbi:tRNA(Cytosine32)-2-thiocytidine synthetase [hydrothermal vent metagenome]|uniref:tRNA(Cytosine32)-2-thiocytidine synthetase n=1 Tax=hydrothermal vent metagenome TaxID=652676 RepID=A0A3B0YVD8_9ZZZZ
MKLSNNSNKLQKRLIRETGKAICDFNMIEDGDRIMVCISGGKDSYSLLNILLALQARAPIHFDLVAMNLDQKQPGFPDEILPAYFEKLGVDYKIVTEDTYSIVKEKIPEGKTTCSLCSRLRRGIIYRTATELGATKIALGHHREDIVETMFLNMFFGARLKAMPAKLKTDDGKHIVIRPLAYCAEKDIARFARAMQFPIIPCNLCGTQVNAQRQLLKKMLAQWELDYPGRTTNILKSLQTVVPSHLMDSQLHDFINLTTDDVDPGENITLSKQGFSDELQLEEIAETFEPLKSDLNITIKIQ